VDCRDRGDLTVGYGDNFSGPSSASDQGRISDGGSLVERQNAIFEQLGHQFGQRESKSCLALALRKDFFRRCFTGFALLR